MSGMPTFPTTVYSLCFHRKRFDSRTCNDNDSIRDKFLNIKLITAVSEELEEAGRDYSDLRVNTLFSRVRGEINGEAPQCVWFQTESDPRQTSKSLPHMIPVPLSLRSPQVEAGKYLRLASVNTE